MYIVRTYIPASDILDRLSNEGKEKGLNRCVCLEVIKDPIRGDVQITYGLFKEDEEIQDLGFRQRHSDKEIVLGIPENFK